MSIEKAKKHFLGKDGHERLDCTGSILKAFPEFNQKSGSLFPGDECGAYHAAEFLLKKDHPEKIPEFKYFFENAAGSTKCAEIRKLRRLSCLGCVEKAAEYLSSCLKH